MYVIYVDDLGDETCSMLSALAFPDSHWNTNLGKWLAWRAQLQAVYGLPKRLEIHSQEWLSKKPELPKGSLDRDKSLPIFAKDRDARRNRFTIFEKSLEVIAGLKKACVDSTTLRCNYVNME